MNIQERDRLNLASIKRIDQSIISIKDSSSHAVLYELDVAASKWRKQEIEGALFLYQSIGYGCIIMNRLGIVNLQVSLDPSVDMQMLGEYIMYRTRDDRVHALWIYEVSDRSRIYQKMDSYCINTRSRQSTPVEASAIISNSSIDRKSRETSTNTQQFDEPDTVNLGYNRYVNRRESVDANQSQASHQSIQYQLQQSYQPQQQHQYTHQPNQYMQQQPQHFSAPQHLPQYFSAPQQQQQQYQPRFETMNPARRPQLQIQRLEDIWRILDFKQNPRTLPHSEFTNRLNHLLKDSAFVTALYEHYQMQ